MDQATLTDGIARIEQYAKETMTTFEMPGLQIALTDRDNLISSISLGLANVDAKVPVTDTTLFEIGSIGKSFTAICLLQLADEGRVDLHAPFSTQLPWWSIQSQYEPITAHDLLSHTAGVVSGTDFTPEQRYEVWSLRNTETLGAPGSRFHYSNVGYKSLGLLIEHVTGQPYGDVVRERILEPLGMSSTIPSITQSVRHRIAVGYQDYFDDRPRVRGRGVFPAPWLETDSGDGCICATADDLAIFLRMFMNRGAYPGGRILTEDQFATMAAPRIVVDTEENLAYGYGVMVPAEGPPGIFEHGGGMVGFISAMNANLTTGFGAVVFTNSMNDVSGIAGYALDVLTAVQANDELPDFPKRDNHAFRTHAGRYVGRSGAIEIVPVGDAFVLRRDGIETPLEYTPWRGGALIDIRSGEDIFPYSFTKNDEGETIAVLHGSEEWVPEGEPLPEETDPELLRLAGHYRSYNPWQPNFRIIARGSNLYRAFPDGTQHPLARSGDGWTGDSDEEGPERFWIDVFVDGLVARVRDQLGSSWERVPGL